MVNNFMLKKILAILILPIFILSCSKEVQKIENSKFLFGTYISITVYDKAWKLGISRDIDPFITLSFMALPVIPSLRLTDLGLVDVDTFQLLKS